MEVTVALVALVARVARDAGPVFDQAGRSDCTVATRTKRLSSV